MGGRWVGCSLARIMFLDKQGKGVGCPLLLDLADPPPLVVRLGRGGGGCIRLDVEDEKALALAAALSEDVDALRVAAVDKGAGGACVVVFVADGVRVAGSDGEVWKGGLDCTCPGLKHRAVGGFGVVVDQPGSSVAHLVCQRVAQPVFCIQHLFRQLDLARVLGPPPPHDRPPCRLDQPLGPRHPHIPREQRVKRTLIVLGIQLACQPIPLPLKRPPPQRRCLSLLFLLLLLVLHPSISIPIHVLIRLVAHNRHNRERAGRRLKAKLQPSVPAKALLPIPIIFHHKRVVHPFLLLLLLPILTLIITITITIIAIIIIIIIIIA